MKPEEKNKTVGYTASVIKAFSWLLLIFGVVAYGRFIQITITQPDLSIREFDEKYFSVMPAPMNSLYGYLMSIAVVFAFSVTMLSLAVFIREKLSFEHKILFIINGILILIIAFSFM